MPKYVCIWLEQVDKPARVVKRVNTQQEAVEWLADRTGLPQECIVDDLRHGRAVEDGEPGTGDRFYRVLDGLGRL